MEIERILTENPYVDELVYYCKVLGAGCILKNPTFADNNETLESAKASRLYMSCMTGSVIFEQFNITRQMLTLSSVPRDKIEEYALDNEKIPFNKRKELIDIASQITIDNYVELNNYYRMLNGQPNVGDKGIYVTNWKPEGDIVIDLTKPIHKMDDSEIGILQSYKILDPIKENNPNAEYLDHLGDRKVTVYDARRADRFDVLYLPSIDSAEVFDRFKKRMDVNRVYTLKTVYSEAFKYGSDYYDSFIAVFIIIQTMVDVISSIQEFIAKKEVFDLRSIKYIFQSYGMPFYPEIPTKYQVAMMKNINTLIKYKSTSKGMVDICSLFGFDNIEVFKYYLLRNRQRDVNGEFKFETKEIQDPAYPDDPTKTITVPDDDANYDLKFVRIPLEDNADDYLRDPTAYLPYDDVTLGDPTWDGDKVHEMVKSQIINEEFTHVRTKYISIDTVYEVTKLSFELPYFFNILYDDVKLEENLMLLVPSLSSGTSFRLTDIFCYLFALTYAFNNIEDSIMDTTGKVLYVKGFNFKADLAELGSYIQSKGFTMEELGISSFIIPKAAILSYNQLLEIFTKNGKVRDHVIQQMLDADNKKIYDIYSHIYDALMITDFTNNYFRDKNTGEMPATYTEYLQRRSPILYLSLTEIQSTTDNDVKVQKIATTVNNIIYALDEFIDSDKYKYIYSNLPSVSGEHIKQYVVKVINFFKSYKVDMLGINTIYKFDDKLDNTITIIDDIVSINHLFDKNEFINMMDRWRGLTVTTNPKENIKLLEKIYMDIKTWVNLNLNDEYIFTDKIASFVSYKLLELIINMDDNATLTSVYDSIENVLITDTKEFIVSLYPNDSLNIQETIDTSLVSLLLDMIYDIKEKYQLTSEFNTDINIIITDIKEYICTLETKDVYNISDNLAGYLAFHTLVTYYDIMDTVELTSVFDIMQNIRFPEVPDISAYSTQIEKITALEKLYIDIKTWVESLYKENINLTEITYITLFKDLPIDRCIITPIVQSVLCTIYPTLKLELLESIAEMNVNMDYTEVNIILEAISISGSNLFAKDDIKLKSLIDAMYVYIQYKESINTDDRLIDLYSVFDTTEVCSITDNIQQVVTAILKANIDIMDIPDIVSTFTKKDISIYPEDSSTISNLTKSDTVKLLEKLYIDNV